MFYRIVRQKDKMSDDFESDLWLNVRYFTTVFGTTLTYSHS